MKTAYQATLPDVEPISNNRCWRNVIIDIIQHTGPATDRQIWNALKEVFRDGFSTKRDMKNAGLLDKRPPPHFFHDLWILGMSDVITYRDGKYLFKE